MYWQKSKNSVKPAKLRTNCLNDFQFPCWQSGQAAGGKTVHGNLMVSIMHWVATPGWLVSVSCLNSQHCSVVPQHSLSIQHQYLLVLVNNWTIRKQFGHQYHYYCYYGQPHQPALCSVNTEKIVRLVNLLLQWNDTIWLLQINK